MRLRKNTIAMAAAACTLLITNASRGAVLVTFEQVGTSVTATWEGTINTTGMTWRTDTTQNSGDTTWGVNVLYGIENGAQVEFFTGGTAATTDLNPRGNFDTITVATFGGFNHLGYLWITGSDDNQEPISSTQPMNGNITWTNASLSNMGAGNFNNTLAYTAAGGDTIRFTTIPEPGSAFLASIGILVLGKRIRRTSPSKW